MPDLGYDAFDADNHLYEPEDAFTRHLDKQSSRQFQYVDVNGRKKLMICGRVSDYIPNPTFSVVARPGASTDWYRGKNPEGKSLREMFGKPEPCRDEYRNRDARLKKMDEQGLGKTLLHPTLASAVEQRMQGDANALYAVVHSFNQWMEEEWGFRYEDRIYAIPIISLMEIDRAVAELEWCLERGAKGIGLRPAPVPGYKQSRSPGAEEFDPFWARVAEADIPVIVHSSDSSYDEYASHWDPSEEFLPFQPSAFRYVTMSDRPIFDMMAALVTHGVFTRHPSVKVLSIENGAGWVAPLLAKLTRAHTLMPSEFSEPPSETFHKNIWVAPYYEEPIRQLADAIGVEHVLFGSDFPHPEGLADPVSFVDELEGFSDGEIKQIMRGNLEALL